MCFATGVSHTPPPDQCIVPIGNTTGGPHPIPTHPLGGRVLASLQKTLSMGIHGPSSHSPVGLPGGDHLRGGTHPPYRSKGSFYCLLPSTTNDVTRRKMQGARRPSHRIATPCSHTRRGFVGHLGRHLPKDRTYIISSLQDMERDMTPIFQPRQRPEHSSCIDHLAFWDPRHMARQTEDT